jgi:beta-glucosidase
VVRIPWTPLPKDADPATATQVPPESTDDVKSADLAVVCVGFDGNVKNYFNGGFRSADAEGEQMDRTYSLPSGQVEMVQEVLKLNPRTVVILNAGGSVKTEGWLDGVPVLLDAFYPGQAGGTALAEIILGKTNPSGKLPFSWEKRWEDSAAYGNFPTPETPKANTYKEGILLGYRWFDTKGIEPLFPFGFGLSFTPFAYSNLEIKPATAGDFTATFTIQNKGALAGAEIAQLYVAPPSAPVPRPVHELKGFVRVALQPGESKSVSIPVAKADLAYWSLDTKQWTVTAGSYKIEVGGSSRDLPLQADLTEAESMK